MPPTPPTPPMKIHPRAVVRIAENPDGTRFLVRITCADRLTQASVRAAFVSAFPRHGDRAWRGEENGWSIPLTARRRLEEWLAHARYTTVVWDDDNAGQADAS